VSCHRFPRAGASHGHDRETALKRPATVREFRTLPLPESPPNLGRAPKENRRKPDDLVFTAPEGGPVQLNVWRLRFWAPAVRNAGLAHLRPHDLRRTAVALRSPLAPIRTKWRLEPGIRRSASHSTATDTRCWAPSSASTMPSTSSPTTQEAGRTRGTTTTTRTKNRFGRRYDVGRDRSGQFIGYN
jgi:hypothetical protein